MRELELDTWIVLCVRLEGRIWRAVNWLLSAGDASARILATFGKWKEKNVMRAQGVIWTQPQGTASLRVLSLLFFFKLRQVQQVLQGPFLLRIRIASHRNKRSRCWNAMASQNVTRLLFSFSICGEEDEEESGIKEARQHTRSCRRRRRRRQQIFFFIFFRWWWWRCSS